MTSSLERAIINTQANLLSFKHWLDVASAFDFIPVSHTHDLAHSTALCLGGLLLNVCLWPVVPSRASACSHPLMHERPSSYSTLLPDVTLGLMVKWSNLASNPPPFAKVGAVKGWSIDTAWLVSGSPFSLFCFMLGTVVCTWHISMLSRCFITAGREGLFHRIPSLCDVRTHHWTQPLREVGGPTHICFSHLAFPMPLLWVEILAVNRTWVSRTNNGEV